MFKPVPIARRRFTAYAESAGVEAGSTPLEPAAFRAIRDA
jgi:hypothetical protein